MSGAVAAHAAYNGSGTQGLAVTNKIHDDDGDVMSVFWNKNDTTRQLLYGSSIIEIPASGSGGNLVKGGNQLFTVNNDIDALGDLYLQITAIGTDQTFYSFSLLSCIKRIEFMVGTQVWQTLETEDIGALNMTEMSEDSFKSFALAMTGVFTSTGTLNKITAYTAGNNAGTLKLNEGDAVKNVTGVLRLPMLSRSIGPKLAKFTDISEQSYLLAGAPHQAVKIRVYMNSNISTGTESFQLKLFGQCIVMCNEERDQIKTMPMGLPKRLKMTQNSKVKVPVPSPEQQQILPTDVIVHVPLDLDHFSLFASHIILYVESGDGSPGPIKNSSIVSAELKLNSSSFSGTLEGPLLTGSVCDALGLYSNGIFIDGANVTDNFYVFPLASHAYGGSSVPLNRFDNIRMELSVVLNFANHSPSNITVSATCVGETTALYKGGAASLAMY